MHRIEVKSGVRGGGGEKHRTGCLGHTSYKFIMCVCVRACVCDMHVCTYSWYVLFYVFMYVCVYICIYVNIYLCDYLCMCIYICICK